MNCTENLSIQNIEQFTNGTKIEESEATRESIIYCGQNWKYFWSFLNPIIVFNYLIPLVCTSGCITNVVNIFVLTRKPMRNPTNRILTALAITDFLFVTQELVYMISQLNMSDNEQRLFDSPMDTINRLLFSLLHTWTIYLTSTVAIWRWVGVVYPLKSRSWLSFRSANWAIFLTIFLGTLICIIFYFVHKIPGIQMSPLMVPLVHAILIKMIPCVTLAICNIGLVRSLFKAKHKQRQLTSNKIIQSSPVVDRKNQNLKSSDQNESSKTTKMLLVILLIFILTEFPPGIFSILEVFTNTKFYSQCQEPVLPFLNLNEYFSSTTNFFVFLIMSQAFRKVLSQHISCGLCLVSFNRFNFNSL